MKKIVIAALLLSPLTGNAAHAEGDYMQTKADGDKVELKSSEKLKVNESVVNIHKMARTSSVPAFKPRTYKGKVREENVLVVLMDFPDSPQSTLTKGDTQNYYDNYTKAYYNTLFFGNTYKAPDGSYYNTLKTYYEKASGSSLRIKGQVTGWYRAKHPLKYYGDANDKNVGELIMEAAVKAATDPKVNMKQYDRYDYYDLDKDGNIYEPDGIIDKMVVIFSGVGESEGGGRLGSRSIWEHVSEVPFTSPGHPQTITGTTSNYSKFYKKRLAVAEYGIMAEDSTVGTLAHEFGHMLGLIDEYDVSSSAVEHGGEPVRYWSLMSYGADAGKIHGTMPVSLSPLAKSDLQQLYGGNWTLGSEINYGTITAKGKEFLLDQAGIKGSNNDVVKVNLPPIKKIQAGKVMRYNQYYLLEWRSHNGLDKGLSYIYDPFGKNRYGKGLVIWYVNESYRDNGDIIKHPGKSLLGVVDANPQSIRSKDGYSPVTDTQIYDAAFNTRNYGNYNSNPNYFFKKPTTAPKPLFSDSNYTQTALNHLTLREAGRVLPQLGLKIKVVDQNSDGTVAKIKIYK
ncbi:M6 family metalloprotease domain-containing protein [Macrococcus equipercicus]|uniref:M6 family metalloprotease domain-containing protein n=1 Tax=Macrococcus equipercicus TaxID=69967 RepID=A0ABQ6RAX5_9STAP|nr:immune inhibitor A domain-containing protein [Macrococcus equipercicus]KAA1042393.1 M6 family metalloprotease domain-containing protein [Macrococcus equipercicus]